MLLLLSFSTPEAEAQRFVTREYGFGDGLTSPVVRSLAEGPDGRLWAGLRTSVFWSDGSSWHELENAPSMVTHIDFDGEQMFGASTYRRLDFFRVDGDEWTRLNDATYTRQALSLASHRGGSKRTWLVGTRVGQLWLVDESGAREEIEIPELLGGPIYDVDRWQGSWWLSSEAGLFRFDDATRELTSVRATANLGVATNGDHAYYVGLDDFGRLDEHGAVEPLGSAPPIERGVITQLAADGDRGLWLGNRNHLWWLGEDGDVEDASQGVHLESRQIQSLLVDSYGTLWIGTDAGLIRLVSRQFTNVSAHDGLRENEVTSIRALEGGRALITSPRWLHVVEGNDFGSARAFRIPGRGGLRVPDVEQAPDGSIWVAGGAPELFRLSPSGSWTSFPFDADVASVHYASGSLWVGTLDSFFRWTGTSFEEVGLLPPDTPRAGVRVIRETQNGDLLLGAAGAGLVRFDPRTRQVLDHWAFPSPRVSFWAPLERADGSLLICASGGLMEAKGGELQRVEWFSHATPFSLLEDDRGDLWLGAVDGLYRWDGESLERFDVLGGLASHELNRNALVQIGSDLWVGGDRGLSLLDLDYRSPGAPVRLLLDRLSVDGASVSLGGLESLSMPSAPARIAFSAFSAGPSESLEISHRLEGLDLDWSEPAPLRSHWIELPPLPPGRYRFALRGRTGDADWSETTFAPWFVVPRAWWQSRLVWLAGAATLLVFIGLVISFAMQRRYASLLEAELEDRWTELKASEERWGQVLDGIAEGVIAVSEDGQVQAMNPAAAALLDVQGSEVLGEPFASLAPGWLVDASTAPREVTKETTVSFEEDGKRREIDVAVRQIAADTRHPLSGGSVWILRDVTERSRLEEQQKQVERLESLGLLAGGIAHDFNNLLTVVSANLSLVGMDTPEESAGLIDEADRAIDRARDLTRQLLTFSRGGEPVRKMVDPASVLLDAATLALSGTGVALDRRGIRPIPICNLDRSQIHQVFNNLVLNAVEAMKGRGTVRIGCGVAGERTVQLWVEDDGPGMDASVLPRVFDPYFSTKRRGSGLGLTTAFSIASRHGGSLTARSTPGVGTRFTIELPIGDGDLEEGALEQRPAARGGAGKILLMDDEASILEVTRRILERHGYEVDTAADGQQAIDLCREAAVAERAFDLAILDLTVPGGKGGAETCRELQSAFPGMPAIVSSGYADLPVMSQHRDYGFVDVLPKPFSADELLRKVGGALASSVPIEEGREDPPLSPVWSGQGDRQLN